MTTIIHIPNGAEAITTVTFTTILREKGDSRLAYSGNGRAQDYHLSKTGALTCPTNKNQPSKS